jgi:hypothetical protein
MLQATKSKIFPEHKNYDDFECILIIKNCVRKYKNYGTTISNSNENLNFKDQMKTVENCSHLFLN